MNDPAPAAQCGKGALDGAVWRPGDPVKHLGPPASLSIHLWSLLFSMRCGLDARAGDWRAQAGDEDDDFWCPDCLVQAGIPFELYQDED